ncbi:MAG TPA: ABC transporter substrate-binding protein [Devosiaceae bacterium]|jgi:ABC-type glycerol-3-phosphate transport system substrate-binding protein|nr:ABC transporter substrate-binding protein [Devosiaceae bacterium]
MLKRLLMVGTALTAVGSSVPAGAQDIGEVTVFHRWADEGSRLPIEAMFAVCEENLPGLEITSSYVSSDQYEVQLPVQLSSDNVPDVYGLWPGGRAVFQAQSGNILDISEEWHDTIGANFAPGMTDSVTETDGNIYVVPFNTIPNGFLYNKKVFSDAGVEAPPETWEEFEAVLAKLKESGVTPIALGARNGWEPMFWFDYLILREHGSDFRERLMAGDESYTSPEVVSTMERWKGLLEDENFHLELSGSWAEMTGAVATGVTAMELMGPWAMRAFLQAGMEPNVDFGFFQFPTINPDVALATEGAFEGWAASGKGSNTEGAVRLLECLASKEAQAAYAQGGTNLAANADVPVDVYTEDLRPILAQMSELNEYPFHQNMELATLPPVIEVADREFPRFLTYPAEYMAVLEALQARAETVFGE